MKNNIRLLAIFVLCTVLTGIFCGCGSHVTVGVDEEPATIRTTTCTTCDGEGVCPHCDGEAFRDGRRCRTCEGNGTCRNCSGKGRLEVIEIDGKDYIYCVLCHGKGICDACGGNGKSAYWDKCVGCGGVGECRFCRGKGVTSLQGF